MSTKKPPAKYAVYIAAVSPEAIREARAALNDILRIQNAQSTKVAAMEALVKLCAASGGNTFNNLHVELP